MAVPKQNILGSLDGKVRTAVRFKLVPSFEDILEKTGNFGIWQMLLYLIYLIIDCSIGLTFLAAITATEVPGWKWSCSAQGDDITNYNFTANGNTSWCPPEGIHCENITFENSLSSIVTEWNLICDKQHITRDISTLYFAGLLLGALTGGCSSDFLGRRKVTLISWPLMMLFQTFTGVSVSWFMYLVLRIATGFATGCCLVPAGVLAIENMGTKSRVVITHRLGFSLAFFMTAVVSFLLEDWRHRAYATGLLLVPALPLLFLFLPESPRWLLQKNRIDEAEIVVKKIAKFNRRPCPNVTTLTHLSESNMKERRKHGAYTVLDLFATREFGSRTLVICYTWFASYVTTFGTVEVIIDFNVALALKIIAVGAASLIAKSTTIYLVNRLGRKRSFLANVTLSTLSNIAITALNIVGVGEGPNGDAILAAVALAGLTALCSCHMVQICFSAEIYPTLLRSSRGITKDVTLVCPGLALAGLTALCSCHMVQICFSAEIYPTLLRSTAYGVSVASGIAGYIFSPFIGMLSVYHTSLPFVVYGSISLLSAILVAAILPETRGRDLSEELPPKRNRHCCTCACSFKDTNNKFSAGKLHKTDKALVRIAKETNRDYKRDYFQMDFSQKPRSVEK